MASMLVFRNTPANEEEDSERGVIAMSQQIAAPLPDSQKELSEAPCSVLRSMLHIFLVCVLLL